MLEAENLKCLEFGETKNFDKKENAKKSLQKNQCLKGTIEILWLMGTINIEKKSIILSNNRLNKLFSKKKIKEINIVENVNNILTFEEEFFIYQKGVFLRGLTFLFYKKFLFFEHDLFSFMKNFYAAISQGAYQEGNKKDNFFPKALKSKTANRAIVQNQKNKKNFEYHIVDYEETQIKKSLLDEECDEIWKYISKKEEAINKNDKSLNDDFNYKSHYYDKYQNFHNKSNDENEKKNKFDYQNELEDLLDCKDMSDPFGAPFNFTNFKDLDYKYKYSKKDKDYFEEEPYLPFIMEDTFAEDIQNSYLSNETDLNICEEFEKKKENKEKLFSNFFEKNSFQCKNKNAFYTENNSFKALKIEKKRKLYIDGCVTVPLNVQQSWLKKKLWNQDRLFNFFENTDNSLCEMPYMLQDFNEFWIAKLKKVFEVMLSKNGNAKYVALKNRHLVKKIKSDIYKKKTNENEFTFDLKHKIDLGHHNSLVALEEKISENENDNLIDENMQNNDHYDENFISDKWDEVEVLRGVFENREDSHHLPFNFAYMNNEGNRRLNTPSSKSHTHSHRKSKSSSLRYSDDFELFDRIDVEADRTKKAKSFIDSNFYTPPYHNHRSSFINAISSKECSKKSSISSGLSSVFNNIMLKNTSNKDYNNELFNEIQKESQLENIYQAKKENHAGYFVNNFLHSKQHAKFLPLTGSQGLPEETYTSTSSLSSITGYNIITWKYKKLIDHMLHIKKSKKEKLRARRKTSPSSHSPSLLSHCSSDSSTSTDVYIKFEEIASSTKVNKITAANAFCSLLILATHNQVQVFQEAPFSSILIYSKRMNN